MTRSGAKGLAVLLAVVFVAVGIGAALILPQLGALSLAVSVIVLLHVFGYLALGMLLLLLGPRQAERLRAWLRRRHQRREPLTDTAAGSPRPPAVPPATGTARRGRAARSASGPAARRRSPGRAGCRLP